MVKVSNSLIIPQTANAKTVFLAMADPVYFRVVEIEGTAPCVVVEAALRRCPPEAVVADIAENTIEAAVATRQT